MYTLKLNVDGLLKQHIYNDASHAFSAGDWDLGGETVALDGSGRLQFPYGSGVQRFGRLTTVADQTEMCVATLSRVFSFGGTTWLGAGALCSASQTGLLGRQSRISAPLSIDEDDSGTLSNVNTGSSYAFAAGSFHWMILHANASVLTYRNHSNSEIVTGSQIAGSRSGKPGIWRHTTTSGNLIWTEQFYAMKGRYAIFSGLAQNMVVACYGSTGTLVESQTADAGGIATFDMLGANLLFTNVRWIVVYDTDGTTPLVIKEYATTGANRRGLIGGDEWVLSTVTSAPATIVNPGGEVGDNTGWTSGGGSFVPSVSTVSKRTGSYSWRLHSTLTQTNYRYQDVSVPAQAEGKIDGGASPVSLLYWQNGLAGQNDGGWIDMEFYSAAMSLLGASPYTVNRALQGSGTTFRPRGETVTVPANTRTVRLYLRGNQNSGTDPDAYIDDIELNFEVGGPDQPTITGDPDSFFIDMQGSAYSNDEGYGHAATQWQVSTDAGFSTVVYDETDTYAPGEAPNPPIHTAIDLNASTNYWIHVRYKDTQGQWSAYSSGVMVTTDAGNAPNTPSITDATPSYDQVTLAGSTFSDTETPARDLIMVEWQVDESGGDYSTPVAESLEDIVNFYEISLSGLTASTAYIARYRQRADDGSWSAWSANKSFSTTAAPASPPSTPTASLTSKTSHSLTIQGTPFVYTGQPYSHAETLVQASTSSSFPSGSTEQVSYEPGKTSNLLVDNLNRNTLYYYRIRYRASDGVWSNWSATKSTTTLTDVLDGAFLYLSSPRHGAVIRGIHSITFTPTTVTGGSFEIEYTKNWSTWIPITTGVSSPLSWDVSALEDGVYGFRIRATDGVDPSPWEYRAVYVDNAQDPLVFNTNADDGQPSTLFTPVWNTTGHTWTLNETSIVNVGSKLASAGYAALAWDKPYTPQDVDILTEVLNASTGGAFPWSWFPEQAFAGAALAGLDDGSGSDAQNGIVATFYSLPIWPYGSCFASGRGDGYIVVEAFENGVRTYANTLALGKVHFVKTFGGCNKIPRYGIRLKITTVELLPNNRRRVQVQAAVLGMEIDTEAVGEWHFDAIMETNVICGQVCHASKEITTSNAYRSYSNITAIGLDYAGCSSAPPEFQAPTGGEGGVGITARPCTLILQVFNEDRTTVKWEVGTDPDHPNPYLMLPENYEEQEIDIIHGAATIGQVEVGVIDPNQTIGDQYSGWMTEKLSEDSITAIHGTRCKLIRFIDETIGWITIADGPAGTPRMDDSYAAYRWVIRDTRETERKIRAFVNAPDGVTILPAGYERGWGKYGTEYLVPPVTPLAGDVFENSLGVIVALNDYWVVPYTGPLGAPPIGSALSDDAVVLITRDPTGTPVFDGTYWTYPEVEVLWRYVGETTWNVTHPRYTGDDEFPRTITPWRPAISTEGFEVEAAMYAYIAFNAVPGEVYPSEGETVEIAMRYLGPARSDIPILLELKADGTPYTNGELLKDLYDGLYSPRDSVTGAIIPTGILYNEADILAMQDPIRLRITEPVDDLRDWAERLAYAPSGWVPALDRDLLISPKSQVPPADITGLIDINNSNSEPSSDWNAGETIVNDLEYVYPRYYRKVDAGFDTIDRLSSREITIEFRDEDSITKHGEKTAKFDGSMFAAVGDENGEPVVLVEQELGYAQAVLRKLYVFDRFVNGAQIIQIPVFRSVTAILRAGDWVTMDYTWFPDYLFQRRHMQTMGQLIAIRDVDCAWRVLLVEEAFPPVAAS